MICRVARTKEEIEKALSLVYREYEKEGYVHKKQRCPLKISFYNSLPSTTTFIAVNKDDILATVTLVVDTPMGIPMDIIYKDEVDTVRARGRKVAEVSQLSVNRSLFPSGMFSMFNISKIQFIFKLFKTMMDYALDVAHVEDLCIAINPKQQFLYKFLTFTDLGGLKYYGTVNKAPAVAKLLDLVGAEERVRHRTGLHQAFFGKKTDAKCLENKFAMSVEDLSYFFLQKSNIFKKAHPEQLRYLRDVYGPPMQCIFDQLQTSF